MAEQCAILSGDELLVSEALSALKEHIGESPEGFTIYGDDSTYTEIKSHILTAPMDTDFKKLIILRGLPKDSGELAELIPRIPETNFLAILGTVPSNTKLFKAVQKYGKAAKLEAPTNVPDIQAWVKARFAGWKKKVDIEAIDMLINICGTELMILDSEVYKICRFTSEKEISASLIKQLAVSSGTGDTWELLNNIENRNYDQCIKSWRNISSRADTGELIPIPNQIAWKFRMILMSKSLKNHGMGFSEISKFIATMVKIETTEDTSSKAMYSPYSIQQAINSSANHKYAEDELIQLYQELINMMVTFKKYNNNLNKINQIMEMFILNHVGQ